MLPLLTSAEVKALDALAETRFGQSVDLLMEHAGRSVAEAAAPLCGSGRAVVFVGPGNNGGDGLCAARHLAAAGLQVTVILAGPPNKLSKASAVNLQRWRRFQGVVATAVTPRLGAGDLVIDALLGSGLSRPPEGRLLSAIRTIQTARGQGARVVAVDLPSGVDADTGATPGKCVQADLTVTLGAHKRGLWQEPGATAAGRVVLGTLGLPPQALGSLAPKAALLELADVQALFPRRAAAAFKNAFGHVVVVAGSPGKTGAAALAVRAALRSGAGLVTLAARAEVLDSALQGHPEAMSFALPGEGPLSPKDVGPLLDLLEGKQALAIGPGLWRDTMTTSAITLLLEGFAGPTVLDADALNAIAGHRGLLRRARGPTVITPHPGEMARLLGSSGAEVQADRFAAAELFAGAERTVVVLKGAKTVVAAPSGECSVVPVGGPGLAHGGTGDVLCGLIGGLLGQGLNAYDAARAGAYVHGWVGDRVVERTGQRGLVAGDVADGLASLWAELER